MSIMSPAVYGASWQASALTTYVSSVAALIASARLAASVQQAAMELDLGRRGNE
jgi:hypothetical protein